MEDKIKKIVDLFGISGYKCSIIGDKIIISNAKCNRYLITTNNLFSVTIYAPLIDSKKIDLCCHKEDELAKKQIKFLKNAIQAILLNNLNNNERLEAIQNKINDIKSQINNIKQFIKYNEECDKSKKSFMFSLEGMKETFRYFNAEYIGDLKKEINTFLVSCKELTEYIDKFKQVNKGEYNEYK